MRLNILFHYQSLAQKNATNIIPRTSPLKLELRNLKLNKIRGFTLIETLVVIVVFSILGLFTFSFIEFAIKAYLLGSKERMIYQDASYIMERITKELRDMVNPVNWSNDTAYDTLQFSKRHVTPQDINTNITFRRDANTRVLYRQSGGVSQPLGQNITLFEITRFSTSTCDRSLSIRITLSDGGQTFSLVSRITPKNLGAADYVNRCFNGDYEDVIHQ
jgi:prepilin-type N-terminal cleavage/methylation domain-containing protein